MIILIFLTLTTLSFAQNLSITDFLTDYEEVTQPPLKSLTSLPRCGEAEQVNRFVCVPYYNCDPNTNTVVENSDFDGSNKLNVRIQDDDPKCDHYLEVCCQLPDTQPETTSEGNNVSPTRPTPTRPTPTPTRPTPTSTEPTSSGGNGDGKNPGTDTDGPDPGRVNCGIRNSQGLDFNLVGGTNEANFGEFPWMVAILRKNPSNGQIAICGGSLIAPKVVLTAGHCVQNVSINDIKVRAGEWDSQTQNERIPHQERNVAQRVLHQHFLRSNLYNNIALLILDRPFTKTASVGTVCLPQDNQHFASGNCFAMGWGKDVFGQEGQYAVILKKIQMPLVNNQNCQRVLRKTRLGASFILHRSFICAGGGPNTDTCTGDGGSPLVCPDPNNPKRYLQVGIVAWGVGCGEDQVPGVYTDVANFRSWVDLKLQELDIGPAPYTL